MQTSAEQLRGDRQPRRGMIAALVASTHTVQRKLVGDKLAKKEVVKVLPIESLRGIQAADKEAKIAAAKPVARCLSCAREFNTVDLLLDGHNQAEIEREEETHVYALAVDVFDDAGNVTEIRLFEPKRLR